ncbi:hypothetical protein GA0061105_101607 [Rhizobium aethiopicum]|uniref:Uncharacterized protein n=1 Tax=Rhizobium aethiopicum TaxID=1138170 RepID=A0A1C3XXI8_9HYPH|nr:MULTISPECIES: hypothetical protein [Rhizobium]SCB56774.1 hypothetical protein GA0061105_101607 [Rhizobium aethiopicum]
MHSDTLQLWGVVVTMGEFMNVSKHLKSVFIFASLTLLSANQAIAFTLTRRIRVPDWMDPYMAMFLVFALFGYLGLVMTKPRGVPVKQLSRVKIAPLANFFRVFVCTMLLIFMAMLFVGMALRRLAE